MKAQKESITISVDADLLEGLEFWCEYFDISKSMGVSQALMDWLHAQNEYLFEKVLREKENA